MRAMLLTAIAAGLAVASVAAEAKDGLTVMGRESSKGDPYTIQVRYDDLQLVNGTDEETLGSRVRAAARKTCSELYAGGTSQVWGCREVAWSAAAPQIATAVERARNGQLASGAIRVRLGMR